jgi:Cu2+-exporting ATPase
MTKQRTEHDHVHDAVPTHARHQRAAHRRGSPESQTSADGSMVVMHGSTTTAARAGGQGHEEHSEASSRAAHHSHANSGEHGAHSAHTGHAPDQFKRPFWVSLALSLPVLYYAHLFQEVLGYTALAFPGSQWLPFVLRSVIYGYGGRVFLLWALWTSYVAVARA